MQLYIFPIFSDFSSLFLAYLLKGITLHKAYPGPSTEGYALRGARLYFPNRDTHRTSAAGVSTTLTANPRARYRAKRHIIPNSNVNLNDNP
jgi:hypothetical protein